MMFRVVIRQIGGSFIPIEAELVLRCPAAKPMKAHPDHFESALNDCVVNESCSSRVVGLDGCQGLGMPHFFQCVVDFNSFACIEVECSYFSFGSEGHACFDNFEEGEDGTIIGWKWLVGGEIMVSTSTAAITGFIEVASVDMDGVYRDTFAVCDDSGILGSNVVQ